MTNKEFLITNKELILLHNDQITGRVDLDNMDISIEKLKDNEISLLLTRNNLKLSYVINDNQVYNNDLELFAKTILNKDLPKC